MELTNQQLMEKMKGNIREFYNWAYNEGINDSISAIKYVNKGEIGKDELLALTYIKKKENERI